MSIPVPSPRPAVLAALLLGATAAVGSAATSSSTSGGATLNVVSGSEADVKGGERVCFRLTGAAAATERVGVRISFVGTVPRGRLVVDGEEGFDFRDPQETFSFSVESAGVHQVTLALEQSARIDRLSVTTQSAGIESATCTSYDEEQRQRLSTPPPPPAPPQPAPVNRLEQEAPPPPPAPAPAAPVRQPAASVPAGTNVALTLEHELSTKTAHDGMGFSTRLTDPLVLDGRTVLDAGTRVSGHVVESKDAGRFGRSTLKLGFDRVELADGRTVPLEATVTQVGKGSAKKQGGIIAGSAAGGALLGAVLGHGTGEALAGAALGAAIAAGAIAAKPGESVTLPAGSVLTVSLDSSLEVPENARAAPVR